MQQILAKAIIDGNVIVLSTFSGAISIAVSEEMARCKKLKELTARQRQLISKATGDGILNALFTLSRYGNDITCTDRIKKYFNEMVQHPELNKAMQKIADGAALKHWGFESDFLTEQYALGNIYFSPVSCCIKTLVSCDFKQIDVKPKTHLARITSALKKEGYSFSYPFNGYIYNKSR